jgi:translocation and assembly module TamB
MLGRARKPLLLATAIAGALLAALLAAIGVALTTTAGARASLAALAKLVPGELAFGGVDGSIAAGLVLTNVRYESPEVAATLARIEIDPRLGALLDGRVVLSRLSLEDGTVDLRGSDSAAAPTEPSALPDIPEWLAVRSLHLRNIALTGSVEATVAVLDANVAGPRIELEALEANVAGGQIAASGRARVGRDAGARVEGSWTLPAGADEGATDGGGTRIELAADIVLDAGETPWRATLDWDRLVVRAAGIEASSPMGRLTSTIGAMPIEAELSAELASPALPTPATVTGSARLMGSTVELEELALDTLGGRVVARGVADLGALAGYAAAEYSMLDPSLVDARIDGTLHGNAVAAFSLEADDVVTAAGTLGGTLGGRPLDGTLRASLRGGVAHIGRARVVLEESSVDVAGRVSAETVDLAFDAELPELANWYPPAKGSLQAAGSLSGPTRNPAIDVELAAEDVAVEGLPPLDELSVDVAGTLAAHDARVAARGPLGAFDVRVEQGWDRERLAGSVLDSRLTVEPAGTWTLTAPADYTVAGATVNLESLCYAGPQQAELCASVAADTLRVDANDVPNALADPWLGGARLRGSADLALTLGWRPALHGSFTLTQPTLRLAQQSADSAERAPADLAAIDDLRVTGTLNEQALDAQLTASLAATGDPLEAQVTVSPPTAQGMLDASLSARLSSLDLVDALVEDVERLTGSLDVSLRATGSLAEPNLDGEIAARSLGAVVPPLGIEVTDGRLDARPMGLGTLELTASLCSAGCLELDGSLDLRPETGAPWRATAELRGDSFELVDLEDLRAVIAPELALDATPEVWRVTGDLAIEEGLLAVEAVPRSAIRPVPETVVHGRAEEAQPEELPVPLVVNVDVRLGDVRFEGLGISAELDGSLGIARTAEGQLLVNGTASIEEGTFSAYSQELTIERGDLLFTGPSDNPALDVRATREVEGATVGLTVSGTLRNPESEVFSMPTLPESEALARLVTGRSLASAGTADAEAIERAALGLGIRRALPALERIGDNLGLDELGVDSGNGDDSALVAGRQIGEDVYLRYKHGLFDDFAGLELIYRITERFRLRTETGTAQSIDLLYERNREEDAPLAETESGFEDTEASAVPKAGGLTEPP